jgi:hypothetical protein
MPVIDLTRYIVAASGTWTEPGQDQNLFEFTRADTMAAERLMLRWAGDFVALTGPLSIRVTVQAENLTVPLALVGNLMPEMAASYTPGRAGTPGTATINRTAALSEAALGQVAGGRGLSLQASTIYEYTLEIAAGQAWPFSLSEQLDALRMRGVAAGRFEQLGNNLGYRILIEPAFAVAKLRPVTSGADLPCDFAVADQPNSASFFPVACEPCEGHVIGLPPAGATTLVVPPAEGGCVRTRFFNGMFITREDLETEQRYLRLKSRLHNRASGAGVVWGLDVCKRGSAIWISPGYGVDCCGNDLALTTLYKVEIAALLADPAAAAIAHQRGRNRMHLLLEYIECPSDPRPVHGDPCTPQANRCEMSRIRESVRLRLVPPRDYSAAKESAPLALFLEEVRQLRSRFPLDGFAAPAPALDRAPFQLRIFGNFGGMTSTIMIRPSPQFDQQQLRPLLGGRPVAITIDVVPDPLWAMVGGTQSGQASRGGQPITGIVQPEGPVNLSLDAGFQGKLSTTFTFDERQPELEVVEFRLAGWQAQEILAAEDAPVTTGDLRLTLRFGNRAIREAEFSQSAITARPFDLDPAPCAGEPCAAPVRRLDPASVFERGLHGLLAADGDPTALLPWLHADPARPGKAGDPKALILAALGGWLMEMSVRERAGTDSEVSSTRRGLAQLIYRFAWLLLFGLSERAETAALGAALKRLLEGWCDELLWKGPQCCGDPHGVVIGCAVVEAGTIQSVDPFGGRRWVVHYPLLEHWGGQFGLAPPDLIASRFFSRLCCVAALPALSGGEPELPQGLIEVGGGFVAIGDPARIAAAARERNIAIVERREAGLPEIIAAAIAALGARERRDEATRYRALVLSSFVAPDTIMLLVPM